MDIDTTEEVSGLSNYAVAAYQESLFNQTLGFELDVRI